MYLLDTEDTLVIVNTLEQSYTLDRNVKIKCIIIIKAMLIMTTEQVEVTWVSYVSYFGFHGSLHFSFYRYNNILITLRPRFVCTINISTTYL